MKTSGALLTGIANGYNNYETDAQDRQFELARRAYLLKNADTTSQLSDINLQQAKMSLQDAQYTAGLIAPIPGAQGPQPGSPATQQAPQMGQGTPQPQPNDSTAQSAPIAPSSAQSTPLPPGINTSQGWAGMAAQGRAQQPTRDQAALQVKQDELANMTRIAGNPATPPAQKQAALDAIDSLKKEMMVDAANSTVDPNAQTPQAQALDSISAAGGTPTPVQLNIATSSQVKQADALDAAATKALNDTSADPAMRSRVALALQTKAQALRKGALDFQKEQQATSKAALEAGAGAFAALDNNPTQANYNNVIALHKNDPDFVQMYNALSMTGDINQDRNKIATLAHQGQTANEISKASLEAQGHDLTRIRLGIEQAGLETRQAAAAAKAQTIKDRSSAPMTDANGMPLQGADLLRTLDPDTAANVQAIASGKMKLENISIRDGQRAHVAAMVARYDPTYNQQDFGTAQTAEKAFTSGPLGSQVRSFNVGLNHLDTLQKYGEALKNGDSQTVNALKNTVAPLFGGTAPTDYAAVAPIVSDEVVKAIVGGKNAEGDRNEIKATVDKKLSTGQLAGVINTYKELFKGQLDGLASQYQSGTKKADFYSRFVPSLNADGSPKAGGQMDTTKKVVSWSDLK